MIHSIILLGTLGALYLFVIFTTPVKAPPPKRIVQVDPMAKVKVEKKAALAKAAAAPASATEVHEAEPAIDLAKGRKLFMANCISCHNKDPNMKGSIGPELTDAPIEVMLVKVETGRYPDVLPAGFVPKRKTKLMRKLPHVVKDVPSIYAWIQSVKKK